MARHTVKRIEVYDSGVCIWGSTDFIVFKVIFGSFGALDSNLISSKIYAHVYKCFSHCYCQSECQGPWASYLLFNTDTRTVVRCSICISPVDKLLLTVAQSSVI